MAVKARKRIKHVKEDHFDNQDGVAGGMCSTPKSTHTLIAESKGENNVKDAKEDISTKHEDNAKNEETIDTKPDPNEPNGPSPDNGADNKGIEVGGQGNRVTVEKTEEEEKRDEFSKQKLISINKGAEEILSCLEPQFAHEFKIACAEYKCKDIGIYLLAILNRLSKESDYYNPDFEPEWDRGDIGINKELNCKYCGKNIENPTKVKQVYCSNLCAKYDKERNDTGLIYPDQTIEDQTVEESEQEAFLNEQQRVGE